MGKLKKSQNKQNDIESNNKKEFEKSMIESIISICLVCSILLGLLISSFIGYKI